jgi:hypothetical protein
MTVGSAGDISWAEYPTFPADVEEPSAAQKEAGYLLGDTPAAEHWNWMQRSLARAGVRRYASSEALIQARRAGHPVDTDDIGIVYPTTGIITDNARQSGAGKSPFGCGTTQMTNAGSATDLGLIADGEYLWTSNGAAPYIVRKRSRVTGAVVLDQPLGSQAYPFLATDGFTIFAVDDSAGQPVLVALDRTTLAILDTVTLPAAEIVTAIATDGYCVAVCCGQYVRLWRFDAATSSWGATETDSYDHNGDLYAVAMDGQTLVIAGEPGTGGHQIRVLSYTNYFGVLTLQQSITQAGVSRVQRISWDGQRLAAIGTADTAGAVLWMWADPYWSASGPLWSVNLGTTPRDVVIGEDRVWCGGNDGILYSFRLDGERVSGTAGTDGSLKEFRPFSAYSAGGNSPGGAGRIRTASFTLPRAINLASLRVVYNGGGGAAQRCDIGIYSIAGDLLAHIGLTDTTTWGIGSVQTLVVSGGPVALPAGVYIIAWTDKNNAISFYTVNSSSDIPRVAGMDPFWGFPAENSATGELPATITVPIGTVDILAPTIWVALVASSQVASTSASVTVMPLVVEQVPWDPGLGTNINSIAFDFDGLFVLGDVDAGGKRLKRYRLTNQPRAYIVQSTAVLSGLYYQARANHSLIQPLK